MEQANLIKSKIYIVDDQIQNVLLLENILELSEYENVWSTTVGLELLQKVESEKPDILLLDLMMPGISGYDILEKIKAQGSSLSHVPVIILTADQNQESKKKCLSLGASDFITKPFDINEVILRIKNNLITKSLMDQLENQNQVLEIKVSERTKELELAKKEAEKNELKFRQLFSSNVDLVHLFYLDEKGPSDFIESNDASEAILGYSGEEMRKRSFLNLHLGKSHEELMEILKSYQSSKSEDFESEILTKFGERRFFETKGTRVILQDQEVIMTISRDITARKLQEKQLQDQNQKLREIAWIQSHVIRAPVARAMGLINLIDLITSENKNLESEMEVIHFLKDSIIEIDSVIRAINEKTNFEPTFENISKIGKGKSLVR